MRSLTYNLALWFCILLPGCLAMTSCSDDGPAEDAIGNAFTIPETMTVKFAVSTNSLGNALDSRGVVADYGQVDETDLSLSWQLGVRFAIYDENKNVLLQADPIAPLGSYRFLGKEGSAILIECVLPVRQKYYYAFGCDARGYNENGDTYAHLIAFSGEDGFVSEMNYWGPNVNYDWQGGALSVDLFGADEPFYSAGVQSMFLGDIGLATGQFTLSDLTQGEIDVIIRSAVCRIIVAGGIERFTGGVSGGFAAIRKNFFGNGGIKEFYNNRFATDDSDYPVGLDYYVPYGITFDRFDNTWDICADSWMPSTYCTPETWQNIATKWTVAKLFDANSGWCSNKDIWKSSYFMGSETSDHYGIASILTMLAPSAGGEWNFEEEPGWFDGEEERGVVFSAGGISDILFKLWYKENWEQIRDADPYTPGNKLPWFNDLGQLRGGTQLLICVHD